MTLRILLHETIDPDGALARWCSPELTARGFEVRVFPVQEAVHAFGPDGLRAAMLAVAHEFEPDAVLVHPPYDYLDVPTIRGLQALGAKVVGLAFDEPLFAAARTSLVYKVFREAARAFDRYATTDRASAENLAADGVAACWVPFAASPIPLAAQSEARAPEGHAVLVGRAYARRVALVQAVSAAGIPVSVYGAGWPELAPALHGVAVHGPLVGPAMHAVLAHADAVITTADWEDVSVPMVKARLLEGAFLGARQVVQAAPDLATYLAAPDECLVWDDSAGLVAALTRTLADPAAAAARAARGQARALREHRWSTRWDTLVAGLDLGGHAGNSERDPNRPARPASAWCQLIAMLAHDAERAQRPRLAAALFAAWDEVAPNATARAGRQRLGLPTHPSALVASTAHGLYVRVAAPPDGHRGLGAAGYLDPAPERAAWAFAASPSAAILTDYTDPFIAAMAALLTGPDAPEPAHDAWQALFARALAAAPEHPHAPRWRAEIERLSRS